MTETNQAALRADYWREHIETWRSGRDSQAAYCKAHDLVYHRFVYWRRKSEPGSGSSALREAGNGFAKVTCEPKFDTGLTLSLPNGLVLRGINAANVTVVRQLLDPL